MTQDTTQPPILGIHIAGIAVMVACFMLGLWVALKVHAEVGGMIIGAGAFLYGKLGYKPAGPVLDRILKSLAEREPERVARLTSTPPPAGPPAVVFVDDALDKDPL